MRLTLYIVLIPFARRARLSRESDLFRDSVFAVGGRFCLGRVEWLRVWRKVLVDSGESTLRRQIDRPVTESPSGDRNGLQKHIRPPAIGLPAGDKSTLRRRNLGVLWRKLLISSPLMRGSRGRLVRMGNMGRTDDVGSVGATGCTEDLGHADNLVRVDALGHADNLTYMNNPRHIDNLTTRDT